MLYWNIRLQDSNRKVWSIWFVFKKLASVSISNFLNCYKLWRNSASLSCTLLLTLFNHSLFRNIRLKYKNKSTTITTRLQYHWIQWEWNRIDSMKGLRLRKDLIEFNDIYIEVPFIVYSIRNAIEFNETHWIQWL